MFRIIFITITVIVSACNHTPECRYVMSEEKTTIQLSEEHRGMFGRDKITFAPLKQICQ